MGPNLDTWRCCIYRYHDIVAGSGRTFVDGDTVRTLFKVYILPKDERGKTRFFASQSNLADRMCLFARFVCMCMPESGCLFLATVTFRLYKLVCVCVFVLCCVVCVCACARAFIFVIVILANADHGCAHA